MKLAIQPNTLRHYLLGRLDSVEADHLEDDYFVNQQTLLALKTAEQLLIADYLDHRLDELDRGLFEAKYLKVPLLRKCVEEAKRQREIEALQKRTRGRRVVIALAIAAGLSLTIVSLRWSPQSPAVSPLAFQLSPGVAKSGASAKVNLPQKPQDICLNLEVAGLNGIGTWRANVFEVSLDGAKTSIVNNLAVARPSDRNQADRVSVILNSSLLRPGDFIVELVSSDGSTIESFLFQSIASQP